MLNLLDKILNRLKTIKLWNLLWISLILSEIFTALMNTIMGLLWWGRIDNDLLLIGTVDAFAVGLFVTVIIIIMFREIRNYERQGKEQLKQALREKESLLREIHHRVKNNMAVVSSLLSLEARKIKDATVRSLFEKSQQRVRSMALVHEKLYQTKDLSSINFESYIKSMVLDIISMYRIDTSAITTEINIGDIELDLESAVPCGLIINELLTNAFKHAFPKNGRGVLSINFTRTDGTYTLIIKDNGVGLPEGFDYREADTLGFQLVDILTGQLGGTLQIKSDKGTEAVVMFKPGKD